MNPNDDRSRRSKMKVVRGFFAVTLALALTGPSVRAQTSPATAKPESEGNSAKASPDLVLRTFYLSNISQPSDANEVYTAVRNLLPTGSKSYFVPNQNAIVLQATPEQMMVAQRLINDLDRPKKTYRLTYTITEMDGTKRVGTQHFSMVLVSGQRTTIKQGSRVPVATGSYASGASGTSAQQTQFTYLDVGMNFAATVDEFANGVRLSSKVDQSSIAEEKSGVGPQDPIVRQTSLEGSSFLTPGKPLTLGSVDILGSTAHLDVEVVMERLP
jgi:type II secretory pathway component GspD/PulD (secretin)